MFRAILKALSRRFARTQQRCPKEFPPISLCAEDGNRLPEDTASSEPTRSAPEDEIPFAELSGNGTPEDAVLLERSRNVPANENLSPELNGNGKPEAATFHSRSGREHGITSPELNGTGNSGNAAIPEHAHSVPENEIQMRAYLKWEAAGKPKGHESRFWLEAKAELLKIETRN